MQQCHPPPCQACQAEELMPGSKSIPPTETEMTSNLLHQVAVNSCRLYICCIHDCCLAALATPCHVGKHGFSAVYDHLWNRGK